MGTPETEASSNVHRYAAYDITQELRERGRARLSVPAFPNYLLAQQKSRGWSLFVRSQVRSRSTLLISALPGSILRVPPKH